jgi:hypothetical protein
MIYARLQISCSVHFDLARTLGHRDVTLHFSIDGDRFGHLAADVTFSPIVKTPSELISSTFPPMRSLWNLSSFDFDIAREDVFATVICHRFWLFDDCCCYWFFAIRRMIIVIFYSRIPRFFWNRRYRLLRDESFEHRVVL